MILITVRDVLWRWRRFLVAVAATAVVLALTLVLDGVHRSFGNEATRTMDAFSADAWIVPEGSTSVFLSSSVMPADTEDAVAKLLGVEAVDPIAVVRTNLKVDAGDEPKDANLIGLGTDRPHPPLEDGRWPKASGEVTAEKSVGVDLGDTIQLSGTTFTVVGHTDGLTYIAGVPISFASLEDAQQVGYGGAGLASALVLTGRPDAAPKGFAVLSNDDVRDNILMPLASAGQTIGLILNLLWAVAVMVIGSVVYLTSLDRTRDFAVLKATGATNGSLLGGLALQAGILSGGAALLAVGVAQLLVPLVPVRTELEPAAYGVLFIVAIGVAVLASLVSARRTLSIDPALAFAGA